VEHAIPATVRTSTVQRHHMGQPSVAEAESAGLLTQRSPVLQAAACAVPGQHKQLVLPPLQHPSASAALRAAASALSCVLNRAVCSQIGVGR
jgi:hypothetical protein